MLTTQDLIRYASEQARIEQIDYFDPRCPRTDEVRAWRSDCNHRSRTRAAVFKQWPARARGDSPLIPGSYYGTRLMITPTEIEYIPGQYAAVEIWHAVADYFKQTNQI